MVESCDGYVVHEGCDHIFFIGFLGAGKSTLARNLGHLFHRDYIDTDRMVERRVHKSVRDIFAEDGEEVFRSMELDALMRLRYRKSLLVSCGGGIVENDASCNLMHELGTVVFLDGDLDDSLRQIQRPDKRPDFATVAEARKLFERRRPLYERVADHTIDIRGRSFEEVLSAAGELLWEEGLL